MAKSCAIASVRQSAAARLDTEEGHASSVDRRDHPPPVARVGRRGGGNRPGATAGHGDGDARSRRVQEHHLLCFRDQRLTDDELRLFSRQFGPLEGFPEKDKTKGKIEVYNVANVSPEGAHLPAQDPRVIFQRNNARWHTDSSYRFVPSLASILYGIEVLPEGAEGGETGFSNTLLAYDALCDDMKHRLALHMVHNYEGIRVEPTCPHPGGRA